MALNISINKSNAASSFAAGSIVATAVASGGTSPYIYGLATGSDVFSINSSTGAISVIEDMDILNIQPFSVTVTDNTSISLTSEEIYPNIFAKIQIRFNKPNMIYKITKDIDLEGGILTIPYGCTLDFQGGSLKNGTINGDTRLFDTTHSIFNHIKFGETSNLICDYVRPEWFGAKGDGVTDDTFAFNQILNSFKNGIEIRLLNRTYAITSLDFYKHTDFSIVGYGNNSAHSATRKSKLKAIAEVDYLLEITSPTYVDSVETTYGFSIQNVDIECDNKAKVGIRCRYMVDLYNVSVRRATDAGIVLDKESYPVNMTKVYCQWNKHGLRIESPRTTFNTFRDCEFQFNTGWGIIIKGGVNLSFYSCLVQANWVGGILIEQQEGTEAWLQNLLFVSLYTEGNGRREITDSDYDGNYTLKIKGISDNPIAYADKIAKVLFLNCNFNKYISGQLYDIKGTYDVNFIGCAPYDIVPSRETNTWNTNQLGRVYAENLTLREKDPKILFPQDETNGVYYNELSYCGEGWKKLNLGAYTRFFNVENVANSHFIRNGNAITVISSIKYIDKNGVGNTGSDSVTPLPICISGLPYNVRNIIKSDEINATCICGTGYYISADGVYTPLAVYIRDNGDYVTLVKLNEGTHFDVKDLTESGTVKAYFTYFA